MPLKLIPNIHRATHRIAVYLEHAHKRDITQAEAHILSHLAASGDSTVAELYAAFGHKRSTLTGVLDRLEGRGLVRRSLSDRDRRTYVVRLTKPGRKVAAKAERSFQKFEKKALAGISPQQYEGFMAVIEAVEKLQLK